MVDFYDLDARCEFSECRRLEYLLYFCEYCKHHYCMYHQKVSDHNCSNYRENIVNKKSKKTKYISYKCTFCKKNNYFRGNVLIVINKFV